MQNVNIIPVVLGVLGSVTKKQKWIEKLGIRVRIGLLQKTTLLGTAGDNDNKLSKYKDLEIRVPRIWDT